MSLFRRSRQTARTSRKPTWRERRAAERTARAETAQQLDALKVPRLELPAIADGVDLGSLYELSESLAQQGVR